MMVYFIGGSMDLTKRNFSEAHLPRELVMMAPTLYAEGSVVTREYYHHVGDVNHYPWKEKAAIYAFVRSERLQLKEQG